MASLAGRSSEAPRVSARRITRSIGSPASVKASRRRSAFSAAGALSAFSAAIWRRSIRSKLAPRIFRRCLGEVESSLSDGPEPETPPPSVGRKSKPSGTGLKPFPATEGLGSRDERRRGRGFRGGGADRGDRCHVGIDLGGERSEQGGARFELGLAHRQLGHLAFERVLVDHLPRGQRVDLGAHGRNAVLVGELHIGLPPHQRSQHVVAKQVISAKGKAGQKQQRGRAEQAGGEQGGKVELAAEAAASQVKRQAGPRRLRGKSAYACSRSEREIDFGSR